MSQELEQALLEALRQYENITIERKPDGKYTASWPDTFGSASATDGNLITVIIAVLRSLKTREYWRGQAEQEQEIIKALRETSPLAIVISKTNASSYRWEWWEGFGIGPTFPSIIKQALDYAMPTLLRLDAEQSKGNLKPVEYEQEPEQNEYRCAMCKQVCKNGWTEEEALAESQAYWPDQQSQGREVVCDDCWQKIRPDEHPVEYQQSLLNEAEQQ